MAVAFGSKVTETLRRAAERAALAPSVHNSQPWTFVLRPRSIDVVADPSRALAVLDPRLRQLTVSCGCALFNIRATIAAAGCEPIVERFPYPDRPEVLARVFVGDPHEWQPIAILEPAIDERRTNRREFLDTAVPPEVVYDLVAAAQAQNVELVAITSPAHRLATARLSELADRIENSDESYRAELATWLTDDPRRPDGVQAATVPYLDDGAMHDELPMRAYDGCGIGWLPSSSHSTADQCLLLFCTNRDDPRAWLGVGEALQHVWLELTRLGFSASPLTQAIEVRTTNVQLRQELGLAGHPQLLLRVGRAPAAGRTPRRDIADTVRVAD